MATTTIAAGDLAPALAAYAARMHASVGERHHLLSPVGAWILLALCAAGSDGRLRDALTAALGMDVDDATRWAATLLAHRHPAVSAAAGVWTSPQLHAEDLAGWLARLPAPVERGELPSQAGLDRWVAERTDGLIRQFPVQLGPLTVLVLATALATRVKWGWPFDVVPATELGESSAWAAEVQRVLRSPGAWHDQFIARTERAGDVSVHGVRSPDRLCVVSVIAGRDVRAADVMATAHDLAVAVATGREIAKRSLFDLPLGDSPRWTISEESSSIVSRTGRDERCTAVLPAWSTAATHDLRHDALGFPAVAEALARLTRFASNYDYEANQSVVARYNRTGFEAAAASAIGLTGSAMPWERGILRRAVLRFGHPFGVVAVATGETSWDGTAFVPRPGPWDGLPVYSAWVTEPVEADEPTREELQREADDETVRKWAAMERERVLEAQREARQYVPLPREREPYVPLSPEPEPSRLERAAVWFKRALS